MINPLKKKKKSWFGSKSKKQNCKFKMLKCLFLCLQNETLCPCHSLLCFVMVESNLQASQRMYDDFWKIILNGKLNE